MFAPSTPKGLGSISSNTHCAGRASRDCACITVYSEVDREEGLSSWIVGSEGAHQGPPMLATVRRSNRACRFPAHGFHEDTNFREAKEGINRTCRLMNGFSWHPSG